MLLPTPIELNARRQALCEDFLAPETKAIIPLAQQAELSPQQQQHVSDTARAWIEAVRRQPRTGLDALLQEYALSNQEGVALMCLAEALLRIPDADTVDRLIRDKLRAADWETHLGHSDSLLVNASTWGLLLTGKLVSLDPQSLTDLRSILQRLLARSGEPAIRLAIKAAMRIIGQQFVMAETIEQAWSQLCKLPAAYMSSIDMLGEAAMTASAAENFFQAYHEAIEYIGKHHEPATTACTAPGVSIKLSALHARFELAKRERLEVELLPRLRELCLLARKYNLQLTIDAEEAGRLDPTLEMFTRLALDPALHDWPGLGLAVQAYQKRAPGLIDFLAELAVQRQRRICVRLVKGAYWDSEIKFAQQHGLPDYPVYTRKIHTDTCYFACAKKLFAAGSWLYPQFATHNAYTLASILSLAGDSRDFECQRLHGMGEALYRHMLEQTPGLNCRLYAPVGRHADLLPYLVRRLLENGANTSFVNRIGDVNIPVSSLTADPVAQTLRDGGRRHRHIPLPADLFAPERSNAAGIELYNPLRLNALKPQLDAFADQRWRAGSNRSTEAQTILNPANQLDCVGEVTLHSPAELNAAMHAAREQFFAWSTTEPTARADVLRRFAALLEKHTPELLSLLVREAGRCIPDGIAELREAVDFCRYYAARAERQMTPVQLPGPTGESNHLGLAGRGVMLCISPWNFPLSIFLGQLSAALAAGNCVLAKPASATPLIAARAMDLLRQAGAPDACAQLLCTDAKTLDRHLLSRPDLGGVLFTGSTATAKTIQSRLAQREGPIIPLVAETGGINCMIVDSSALTEQAVGDIIQSAFNSAGQRCSALRLLYVQDDIADTLLNMLAGAMNELSIGDPALLATDIGPVISADAAQDLRQYCREMNTQARLLHRLPLSAPHDNGHFVAPCVYELDSGTHLQREVFGPVLHVVRFPAHQLNKVIDEINASTYGLTLGIHSRIQNTIDHVCRRVRVGNIYVNRNMIGAVVGVQPFGGEGLSGTGPKAGGPHYLTRLVTERVISNNISAIGGNTVLLSLSDD